MVAACPGERRGDWSPAAHREPGGLQDLNKVPRMHVNHPHSALIEATDRPARRDLDEIPLICREGPQLLGETPMQRLSRSR